MTAPMIIPDAAREIVEATFESGVKRTAFYELDGERVGYRCWSEDGSLAMEYGMRGGVRHGPFRTYWENGQASEEATYIDVEGLNLAAVGRDSGNDGEAQVHVQLRVGRCASLAGGRRGRMSRGGAEQATAADVTYACGR